MKQCTKCKEWKDESEFSWKNKSLGKRHSQCKECRRAADNKYYKEDVNRQEAVKATHRNQVKVLRDFVNSIKKESKCSICGDSRWYVLDFHHLRDKKFTISQKIKEGCSLQTMKDEISKCILVCANCHREIHFKNREEEFSEE